MTATTPIRVLTTNDFIGSFHPQATSFGALPGGVALARTVGELEAAVPGVWIDTGDLAQGDPANATTAGTSGFAALRDLPVDVAVVGNHDLDWGLDHLHTHGRDVGFPWLAANADLGFPATHIVPLGDRRLGVVGLTLPRMDTLHPDHPARTDTVAIVLAHAAALRHGGCTDVVLAIHDGVDRRGTAVDTTRMAELCGQLRGHVDLVLGGHTLRRHAGLLGGVPYLQPWPFGSQVGVADLHPDGTVELSTVDVTGPAPWTGPGADRYAELAAQTVGHLDAPLTNTIGGDAALSRAIASALLDIAPDVDIAVVSNLWTQAPRDDVLARLGAGPVTRADVHRVSPLCGGRTAWGGRLVTARRAEADLDERLARLPDNGLAVVRRGNRGAEPTVAVPAFHATTLGLPTGSPSLDVTWRDAVCRLVDPG